MKIYRLSQSGSYYHVSKTPLEIGTILTPEQGSYTNSFQNAPSHAFLEKQKPPNMLSRFNAVFMFNNLYDVFHSGIAAYNAKHVYEVEPLGNVEAHHAEWVSVLDSHMYRWETGDPLYEGEKPRNQRLLDLLKETAQNYWNGEHPYWMDDNEGWEYLTSSAKVINEITSNEDAFNNLKEEYPRKEI